MLASLGFSSLSLSLSLSLSFSIYTSLSLPLFFSRFFPLIPASCVALATDGNPRTSSSRPCCISAKDFFSSPSLSFSTLALSRCLQWNFHFFPDIFLVHVCRSARQHGQYPGSKLAREPMWEEEGKKSDGKIRVTD